MSPAAPILRTAAVIRSSGAMIFGPGADILSWGNLISSSDADSLKSAVEIVSSAAGADLLHT